jgi:hypothetical protein
LNSSNGYIRKVEETLTATKDEMKGYIEGTYIEGRNYAQSLAETNARWIERVENFINS